MRSRNNTDTKLARAAELLASGNPHEGWSGGGGGGSSGEGGGGGRGALASRLAEDCQQVSRCGESQGV